MNDGKMESVVGHGLDGSRWIRLRTGSTGVADPDKGKALAETLCSGCHNVWMGPVERDKTEIPSFYDFANQPDQTPELLAAGIILPHPLMPKVPFTNEELRNIVAYIMSLRTPD